MTWKPSPDIDEEVRRWMGGKGWHVHSTDYDSDREFYTWRHEPPDADPPTLRISQAVLQDYSAGALLEILDRLRVAAAIRACPDACLVIVRTGSRVTIQEME